MPLYVNIGGAKKELSDIYCNIGGAKKSISNMYANIGGSSKEIFGGASYYKFSGKSTTWTISSNTTKYYAASAFSVSNANNCFVLTNASTYTRVNLAGKYTMLSSSSKAGTKIYYVTAVNGIRLTVKYIADGNVPSSVNATASAEGYNADDDCWYISKDNATLYSWDKNGVVTTYIEGEPYSTTVNPASYINFHLHYAGDYTFDSENGYVLNNASTLNSSDITEVANTMVGNYFGDNGASGSTLGGYMYYGQSVSISGDSVTVNATEYNTSQSYSKDASQSYSDVYSFYSGKYPTNGKQSSYWYSNRTAV